MKNIESSISEAIHNRAINVLLLEDADDDSDRCLSELKRSHFDASISVAHTLEEFTSLLSSKQFDIILADYLLRGWGGTQAFEICRRLDCKAAFILFTGALGGETVVDFLKEGISDFVCKDHLARLPMAINRALAEQRLREEHERSMAALGESEQRFRALAESVASGILIYQGVDCRYANQKAEEITGYTREELALISSWEIIHPDSRDLLIEGCLARFQNGQPSRRFELKILTKMGEPRWVDLTLGKIEISGQLAGLFTFNDVTERKITEDQILLEAGSDPLTGLTNGRHLADAFKIEAMRYSRTGRPFSLLVFDLDGLKEINDTYGHLVGSRALCRLANVFRSQRRTIDIIARQGGDEFTVILPETSLTGARIFAKRICERLADDHQHPPLSVSFGAAVYLGIGTFEELFAAADERLYVMKRRSPHWATLQSQR